MRNSLKFAALALLIAVPAAAQHPETALYDRALAAGYKAQFLCSGLWNGGKSKTQIEADELTGIYPHIAGIVPTLTAEIDEERHQVRVRYAEDAPPRVAQWREGLGCAGLPIGADAAAASGIPALRSTTGMDLWDGRPWPMGDAGAIAELPRNLTRIERVASEAVLGDDFGGRTSGVVIVHDGRIVAENYMRGHDLHTSQRTWSVAKSLAGTLVGHGVQRGLIRTDEAADLAAWRSPGDPRAAITVDQLLRMASGLTSDTAGNRTDAVYMGGASVLESATPWPLLCRPGTCYRYANNDTMLAAIALMERLPADQRLGFPVEFFRRIGMTRTIAETDWRGDFILSSQVWTTARDLARLGLLYLNDGMWEGERLLPEGWRDYVTRASGPQPDGAFGYGATFWLMSRSEGVPADAFAAFGNRGQYLVMIPSRDLVIVRRGYDTAENRFDIAAFTRAVVAALGPDS
ncbi:MAG: serine hydrolase [Sphingomonas sp.]|nr:serine hydrolase [Sphingomonas sp.]